MEDKVYDKNNTMAQMSIITLPSNNKYIKVI